MGSAGLSFLANEAWPQEEGECGDQKAVCGAWVPSEALG